MSYDIAVYARRALSEADLAELLGQAGLVVESGKLWSRSVVRSAG